MTPRTHGAARASRCAEPASQMTGIRPSLVCVLGAPGSGKGTQGALLASALGGQHVSVGDLLRDQKARGVRIPHDPRTRLADTQKTCELIGTAIDPQVGFVALDGFPRHPEQVPALELLGRQCELVLWLEVDFAVAVDRMAARGREGESTAQIGMRQFTYERHRAGLLGALAARGVYVRTVNANLAVQAVHATCLEVIHKVCG